MLINETKSKSVVNHLKWATNSGEKCVIETFFSFGLMLQKTHMHFSSGALSKYVYTLIQHSSPAIYIKVQWIKHLAESWMLALY